MLNSFLLFLNLVSLFFQGKIHLQLLKGRQTREVVKQTMLSHQVDSYHRRTPDCQLLLWPKTNREAIGFRYQMTMIYRRTRKTTRLSTKTGVPQINKTTTILIFRPRLNKKRKCWKTQNWHRIKFVKSRKLFMCLTTMATVVLQPQSWKNWSPLGYNITEAELMDMMNQIGEYYWARGLFSGVAKQSFMLFHVAMATSKRGWMWCFLASGS